MPLDARTRSQREREWHEHHLVAKGPTSRAFSEYWETPGGKVRYRRRMAMISSHLREREATNRVLLIGSGYGAWISDFAKTAQSLVAIDISPGIVARASTQAGHGCVVHVADVHDLPYAPATFDACVAISTLHHLDLDVGLSEIARVLRPGGCFVGTDPNRANPQVRAMLRSPSSRRRYGLTVDETAYSASQLRRHLGVHFREVGVQPFDFWHPAFGGAAAQSIRVRATAWLERVPIVRFLEGRLWFCAADPRRPYSA